jgi:hypothetical protein
MDQSNEPLYSAQQIDIPGELPHILKHYTKAVIRAQPSDIISWSRE